MSYQILKSSIKSGDMPHLMHFFGEETYLKNHYIEQVKNMFVDSFTSEFNFVLFEDNLSAVDLGVAVETPPMMSETKLILIKNTGIFKGLAGDWSSIFSNIPDYVYIIADEDNFDKRSAAYKAFSKDALSVDFELRKAPELKAWVTKILTKNTKDMSQSDLDYFLNVSGTDMYSILAQLEKLFSYTGTRKNISHEDIDSVITKSLITKEYSLTDALLRKNKTESFKLLGELFDMRTDPVRLLYIIASAFLSAYKAKAYLSEGATRAVASQSLGIPNRFIADKYVGLTASGDIDFYRRSISLCTETDYKIKLGIMQPKTGLETLCAEILK